MSPGGETPGAGRFGWLSSLATDDTPAAMATAAMFLWLGGVAVVVSAIVDIISSGRLPTNPPISVAIPVALGFGIAGEAVRRVRGRLGAVVALAVPLVGLATTLALNLTTHDASAGAQFVLGLVVILAAAHLRIGGVVLVTSLAIGALAITAWRELPSPEAFSDTVNGAVILAVVALGLVSARRVHGYSMDQLQIRADTDPISGALGRQVLDVALEKALATEHAAGTALLVVDVDHFKSINDSYGHPAGDEALRHLVRVLRQRVRPLDVISRMGGDEFAVLLPDCAQSAALDRAEGLLRDLKARPLEIGERFVAISVSVGVAHAPTNGHDVHALYATADRALYRAKEEGRGRVGVSP